MIILKPIAGGLLAPWKGKGMDRLIYTTADGRQLNEDQFSEWFAEEFFPLARTKNSLVADVVLYHLLVEHYIILYLTDSNKNIGDVSKAKLGFGQLLKLLPKKKFSKLMPALKCLNRIRNKLAHNLNYKVEASAIKTLKSCYHKYGGEIEGDDPVNILNNFAQLCCVLLRMHSMDPKPEFSPLVKALMRSGAKHKK